MSNNLETKVTSKFLLVSLCKKSNILKSSVGIVLITFSTKILGYIEKLLFAYYFGTSYKVDVYNVVFTIILSIFFFFRETTEPGFLNVFLKAIRLKDEKGAWDLFNRIGRYILLITCLLSVIVFFFPERVMELFSPGFKGVKKNLSVDILKFAFPACIFLSLSALTNITLNGLKNFVIPASADLFFRLSISLSLLFLFKYFDIYSLVIGLILGAFIKLMIHAFFLYKKFSIKKLDNDKVYFKEVWFLSWPLFIGVGVSQLGNLIDNGFASFMQEGAISALNYAKKIVEFPIIIFPYTMSVVLYPYFSELAIAKKEGQLRHLLAQCFSWITVIFVPLAIFFYSFSYEIIEVVLKHGAFNENSTLLTSRPFEIYSIGMFFLAIETILVIFYFANSNTKTPILIGIICVVEYILLIMVFTNFFGYLGIAMAFVVAKATKTLILLVLLQNTMSINYTMVFKFLLKVLFSAGLAVAITYLFKIFSPLHFSQLNKMEYLVVLFLISFITYSTPLYLLKVKANLL